MLENIETVDTSTSVLVPKARSYRKGHTHVIRHMKGHQTKKIKSKAKAEPFYWRQETAVTNNF